MASVDDVSNVVQGMHLADLACSIVDLWQRRLYTDLTLVVQGKVLHCHRLVLAAASPYFHSRLFNGKRDSMICKLYLTNVTKPVLADVLEFVYCGDCQVNQSNAQSLLKVSHLYEIKGLKKKCDAFLAKQVTMKNAIHLYKLARTTKAVNLEMASKGMIVNNFSSYTSTKKFQSLSTSEVISLIKDDNLNVPYEDTVCDAVFFWAKADPATRKDSLYQVLKHVRLPEVKDNHLKDILENNELLIDNVECCALIKQSQNVQIDQRRHLERTLPQLEAMKETNMDESIVIIGGATSGEPKFKCNQSVTCFNMVLRKWFPLAPLPFGFDSGSASCVCVNDIYVCGGNQNRQGLVLYKSDDNEWHICAPISVGRRGHALVPIGSKLYALGGAVGHNPQGNLMVTASVEEYCMISNEWTNKGELAEAVWGMPTAVSEGNIYLFGGYKDRENPTPTVQVYNPRTQTSCSVSSLPSACGLLKSVVTESEIHLICPTGEILQSTDCYTFKQIATLPHFTRALFGVAKCENGIMLIGGKYGNDIFDDMMLLDIKQFSVSSIAEKLHQPIWGFACNHVTLPRRHMLKSKFPDLIKLDECI